MVIDEKRIDLMEKLRKLLLYHLVILINMTANTILPTEQNRIIEQSILLLGKYLKNTQKLLKSKEEKNKNHKVFRIS